MGESMDAPISNNHMEDSEATFEVSVSFGRFDNDLLAWEKWSSFPSNKYLEEVEKCSTPGSVAQKKAYFEAHYKRIAARKAEQEEQDKKEGDEERDHVDSEAQPQNDLVAKISEVELDDEVAISESEMSSDGNNVDESNEVIDTPLFDEERLNELDNEVIDLESERLEMTNESKDCSPVLDEQKLNDNKDCLPAFDEEKLDEMSNVNGIELENNVADSASEMKSDQVDEPKDSLDMTDETMDLMPLVDAVKDGQDLHGSEEPTPCLEEVEELPKLTNTEQIVSVEKQQKKKSDKKSTSKKVTSTTTKKATNTTTPLKKKPAAFTQKSSLLSTPKFPRSALSKSTISESKGLSKKEFGTSPAINRKTSRPAAPTSLHMSMRLSSELPASSEPAPSSTMRKSVFMEKMGDKDIVKRAFRAFRNEVNQLPSSSPGKPASASQVPVNETSMKASVVGNPQRKIEGVKNVVKKTPQSSQSGFRNTSNSTRLPHTAVSANQRNVSSVSSTYGLRSLDKPDKRNEFSKKPEEKANGKAAERTPSQSKVKKEGEIKRLPQDHHTKAKPIVGTTKPKSSLDKKSVK